MEDLGGQCPYALLGVPENASAVRGNARADEPFAPRRFALSESSNKHIYYSLKCSDAVTHTHTQHISHPPTHSLTQNISIRAHLVPIHHTPVTHARTLPVSLALQQPRINLSHYVT